MSDSLRVLFVFKDRWRISHTRIQWIVERRQGQGWKALHYVEGKKASLERILREEGVDLTSEADAFLGALPTTFREFQMRHMTPEVQGMKAA